jgi:hypothetical protein
MDETFYNGCSDRCEIYPPWNGFNGFHLNYPVPEKAFELADEILTPSIYRHPNKSQGYQLLHARNMQEVLGPFCEQQHRSDLLICYTRDGCTGKHNRTKYTGGTASAILCAQKFDVPCVNLFNENWFHELQEHTECDFTEIHEQATVMFY